VKGTGVPARIVKLLTYGQDPIGRARAVTMQTYREGMLDGGRLGGLPHYGMRGDPALTYSGYVSSPQTFVGAAQMGANTGVSVHDYPALPSEQAPAANVQWLQDWDQLEGVVPI
jgi:hypothetical protein